MSALLTKDIWISASGWAEEFGFRNVFNIHDPMYFYTQLSLVPLLCWNCGLQGSTNPVSSANSPHIFNTLEGLLK